MTNLYYSHEHIFPAPTLGSIFPHHSLCTHNLQPGKSHPKTADILFLMHQLTICKTPNTRGRIQKRNHTARRKHIYATCTPPMATSINTTRVHQRCHPCKNQRHKGTFGKIGERPTSRSRPALPGALRAQQSRVAAPSRPGAAAAAPGGAGGSEAPCSRRGCSSQRTLRSVRWF